MKGILLILMLDTINPKRLDTLKWEMDVEEKSPEVGWEFPIRKGRRWELHQWGIYNLGWGEELGLSLYIPLRKTKPKRKP